MPCRLVREEMGDVDRVVAWADDLATAAGLDANVRYAVSVCVEEVLSNLILHASAVSAGKAIEVTFEAAPPGATVTVTDACAPFDSTRPLVEVATTGEPTIGGRGLRLLRAFASDMAYGRAGDRNRLTLTFHPAAPA